MSFINGLVLSFVLALPCAIALSQNPAAEFTDPREVVVFVHSAAQLVEVNGERAFAEFHTENTRWLHGGVSVLVLDPQGQVIADPLHPELEGQNAMNVKDPIGRPIVASILAAAAGSRGRGWARFLAAPEPGDEPQWKSMYSTQITDPSGDSYVIAAGFFAPMPSRFFVTDTVNRAADELLQRGGEALPAMNKPVGLYSYGDTSVFVFNQDGTLLADAQAPKQLGQNLFEVRDANGDSVAEKIVHKMERGDRTWIDYQAPRPDDGELAHRTVYIRKVELEDATLYVAAGLFVAP